MEKLHPDEVQRLYEAARSRVLLLDYEGTLVDPDQPATDDHLDRLVGELAALRRQLNLWIVNEF